MPITPYVRPQETITQNLRMTPAPNVNRRNPLVIGPEYLLGNFDTDNSYAHVYDSLVATLPYTYLDTNGLAADVDTGTHTVDTASVKLIAKDIEVRVSAQAAAVAAQRDTINTVISQADGATTTFFTGPVGTLAANLNARPVRIGDILYITNGATTVRRTVTGFTSNVDGTATKISLNGVVPGDAGDALTFFVVSRFSGELDADVLTPDSFAAISADASGVDIAQFVFKKSVMGVGTAGVDCGSRVTTSNGPAGSITVYFRAVRKVSELDGVITVNSLADLAQFGALHVDNDLAYGAYRAFKGNQSSKTYVLRTGGDTVEDFEAALSKIRSTDYYYAIAPMTDVKEVKELVAAHCDEMSNKYNRNFRRCYVGTDTPSGFTAWGVKGDGSYRTATVDNTNKRVVIDEEDQGISNFVADLSVGDTLMLAGSETVTISRIISAAEAEYEGTATSGSAVNVVGIRKDSAANVVKYFQELKIGSRRCVNVWSDNPVYNGLRMPMKFVAAEIAGLRCSLLPQQGLTMTEVLSIESAPGMYTRFTPEQLDTIASNGVMVVTQEIEGGAIFIRHQLTTKTDSGALAYEDNVGVIVDEFSYRVKDAFRQYLGRRNVTEDTMAEIAAELKALAIDATQTSIANREIGPMVIRFFDEDDVEGSVTVRVDGNLADHILTYVRLRVPLPINGIDHYVDVETSIEL